MFAEASKPLPAKHSSGNLAANQRLARLAELAAVGCRCSENGMGRRHHKAERGRGPCLAIAGSPPGLVHFEETDNRLPKYALKLFTMF
jgi:hypothetical protein